MQSGIIWTSSTRRVDIDTGEELTKHQAEGKCTKYIKIKTIKHVTINHIQTRGNIEYIIQYKRNPQREFEFN